MDDAVGESLISRLFGPQSDSQLEQIESLPATPEEFRQRLRESVRQNPDVFPRVCEKAIDACRRHWEPLIVAIDDWRVELLRKRKRRLAAKADKAARAARRIMHKQIATLLSPYGESLLLAMLDEAIRSTDLPALEFPDAEFPIVFPATTDIGMNPKEIREFWKQHVISKKRKRRAESAHATWEQWEREEGLTEGEIVSRHEHETGEQVKTNTVRVAINRFRARRTSSSSP